MPDLTVHTAYTCETNIQWGPVTVKSSSGATSYEVSWGRRYDPMDALYGWSCTCKGFQFRKTCKHVKAVEAEHLRCGWNAELDPTVDPVRNKDGELCCPECGAPVYPEQVAV